MAPSVICEKVRFTSVCEDAPQFLGIGDEFFIRYQDTPEEDKKRASCLTYLRDCGYKLRVSKHTPDILDEPVVSWGRLSDLVAPRDD